MHSTITYTYRPPGTTAEGQPATASGGATITVTGSALAAIQSLIVDDYGRLPKSARATLARIHDRERHSSELGALLRALERRDVFVRF